MALKELYAPRPTFLALLPPFSQEQSLSRALAGEGDTPEEITPQDPEEVGKSLSSSLLHLVVLQVGIPFHLCLGLLPL